MKKKIFLSISTLVVCIMVIVGVTYAVLFDNDEEFTGDLVVGNVDVSAELYFLNGEEYKLAQNLDIEYLKAGETYTYKIVLTNKGTYDVQYRNILTASNDINLLEVLKIEIYNDEKNQIIDFKNHRGVSEWTENFKSTEAINESIYYIDFELNESLSNDYANKLLSLDLKIEAIENELLKINNDTNIQTFVDSEYAILTENIDTLTISKSLYLDFNGFTVNNLNIVTDRECVVELVNGNIKNLVVNAPNSTIYCYVYFETGIIFTDSNSFYYFADEENESSLITMQGGRLVLDTDIELNIIIEEEIDNPITLVITKETYVSSLIVKETINIVTIENNGIIENVDLTYNDNIVLEGNEFDIPVSEEIVYVSTLNKTYYVFEEENGVLITKTANVLSLEEAVGSSYTEVRLESNTYDINNLNVNNINFVSLGDVVFTNGVINLNNVDVAFNDITFDNVLVEVNNSNVEFNNCIFDNNEVAINLLNESCVNVNDSLFKSLEMPITIDERTLESTLTLSNTTFESELSVVYLSNEKVILSENKEKNYLEVLDKVTLYYSEYDNFDDAYNASNEIYLMDDFVIDEFYINKDITIIGINNITLSTTSNYLFKINSNTTFNNVNFKGVDNALVVEGYTLELIDTTFDNFTEGVVINQAVEIKGDAVFTNTNYAVTLSEEFTGLTSATITNEDGYTYVYYSTKKAVVSLNEDIALVETVDNKTTHYYSTYSSIEGALEDNNLNIYVMENIELINSLEINYEVNLFGYNNAVLTSLDDEIIITNDKVSINNISFIGNLTAIYSNSDLVINNCLFNSFETTIAMNSDYEITINNVTFENCDDQVVYYSDELTVLSNNGLYKEVEVLEGYTKTTYFKTTYETLSEINFSEVTNLYIVTSTYTVGSTIYLTSDVNFISNETTTFTANNLDELFVISGCTVDFINIKFDCTTVTKGLVLKGENTLVKTNSTFSGIEKEIVIFIDDSKPTYQGEGSIYYYDSSLILVSSEDVTIDNVTYVATYKTIEESLNNTVVYINGDIELTSTITIKNDITFIALDKASLSYSNTLFQIVNCDVTFNNVDFETESSKYALEVKALSTNTITLDCDFSGFTYVVCVDANSETPVIETTYSIEYVSSTNSVLSNGDDYQIVENNITYTYKVTSDDLSTLLTSDVIYVVSGDYTLNDTIVFNKDITFVMQSNVTFESSSNVMFELNDCTISLENITFNSTSDLFFDLYNSTLNLTGCTLTGNLNNTAIKTNDDSKVVLRNNVIKSFENAVYVNCYLNSELDSDNLGFSLNTYRYIYYYETKAIVSNDDSRLYIETITNTNDIKQYGVKYSTLTEALNEEESEIIMLSGTYEFDQYIELTYDVTIIGENNDVVFTRSSTYKNQAMLISRGCDVYIKGITFKEASVSKSNSYAIMSEVSDNTIIISHCVFEGFTLTTLLLQVSNAQVLNSEFYYGNGTTGYGVQANNNCNLVVTSCTFEGFLNDIDDSTSAGLLLNAGAKAVVTATTFTKNTVDIAIMQKSDNDTIETTFTNGGNNTISTIQYYKYDKVIVSLEGLSYVEEETKNNIKFTYEYISEFNNVEEALVELTLRELNNLYIIGSTYTLETLNLNSINIYSEGATLILDEFNIKGNVELNGLSIEADINVLSGTVVINNCDIEGTIYINEDVIKYDITNNTITGDTTIFINACVNVLEASFILNNELNGKIVFNEVTIIDEVVYSPTIKNNTIQSSSALDYVNVDVFVLYISSVDEEMFDQTNITDTIKNNTFANEYTTVQYVKYEDTSFYSYITL